MENPVSLWHERVWDWFIIHAQRPHALYWLALVAFTDALFFPVAPELFLVALVLAHKERARVYLAVAATCSAIGAATGYFVAAFLFHQFGEPILAFYHLEAAFDTARHFIAGHVFWTMAVASFTPIPDKVFIYAGGFLGVHFVPFFTGYVLGRTARMALFVYLTERYGTRVLDLFKRYTLWFSIILVALGTIYAMVHWHLFGI
jgi:membrane protein YqaA with SNARE-associated domain